MRRVSRQTSVRGVREDTPLLPVWGGGWARRAEQGRESQTWFPLQLCTYLSEALPRFSFGKERPLRALAVLPWRSHLTSLSCGFLPYKMGTITLPMPIPAELLPKSDESWILKSFVNYKVYAQRGMFSEALEKQTCLAPPSAVIQTRPAFPWQDGPDLPTSVSQSLGRGTRGTSPPLGVTHCQTLERLLLEACPLYSSHKCSEMSVKQFNGEGGEGQSCGPINMRLCWDLEGPAFLPGESLSDRVWGALRDSSPNLLIV